ncbi:2-(1,2-epoxy-1,2-dihydrophenyl)acetyl-CoA isomerase PaaG [Terasakiella sp. A23]|uniref:2-(1,2-epoxy-1,2-dihydrophenyl)acetyl-CoA isomerase PaaG n=1 Tax=Terasakiella sp. FCG-A23 TaxID=3080561 RepID=UPI002953ECB8|nr:2-(1,2-epoxy-1,2-dihydrophenyl)acetyl-CoA isomerase PaaG [Terasakiella sp. A23]MDV7339532.1 2-(1,2-epoxy-1,2-dihydrophenyl)acetyl-CoA isomerase PaaG [Terasakiella sp. A23]
MSYETILFEKKNGYAKITLNRPDVLNSFNEVMHLELREALKDSQKDDGVRAILLTAAGRGFCAGQDLGDRAVTGDEGPRDLSQTIDKFYNPLVRLIQSIEKPVVCAVNGVAAGAGANIALACDIVYAAKSASFIQAFCKIGLVPDSGGTWSLPNLIGMARAKALAMLGDKIPAEQAEEWGMIWKCVDNDSLVEETEELCANLAQQPTYGLGLIKRAMNAAPTNTMDQQLDLERDLQKLAGFSDDYKEGVNAFLEKRKPNFTGK